MAAAEICRHVEFRVVTDRPCGVEQGCQRLGLECTRIPWQDQPKFSATAHECLDLNGGCDLVVMFFSRLVGRPLVGRQRLLNVHPALLPAYPGLRAVARAQAEGARFLGATLHAADERMDSGPIVAQICQPLRPEWTAEGAQHVSFLQKTALLLVAIELTEHGRLDWREGRPILSSGWPINDRFNPALTNPRYLDGLRAIQRPGLELV